VIGLSKMSLSQKELLDNEIKILRSINHPHILKLYDIYYTVNNCYIITEYCAGGNLEKII
jgi:serine/threonine-protein kinase ULK/ATG1